MTDVAALIHERDTQIELKNKWHRIKDKVEEAHTELQVNPDYQGGIIRENSDYARAHLAGNVAGGRVIEIALEREEGSADDLISEAVTATADEIEELKNKITQCNQRIDHLNAAIEAALKEEEDGE